MYFSLIAFCLIASWIEKINGNSNHLLLMDKKSMRILLVGNIFSD